MTPRLPFNLFLMFTLLWPAQAWGHAAHCPQVDKGLQYNLVDQEGVPNIPPTNKVEWKIFRGHSLDLNFTSQTLWVKIQWLSKAPGEQKCILVVDYPFLDKITLYEWDDTNWAAYHSGDRSPTSDAIAYARHPSFVFQSAPGPNVIYLKVTTRGLLRLPLEVYDYESGHQSFVTKSIISAALLGAICLIIVYSLSLFLTSREPSIFFYAILQTLVLYKNACDLGFTRLLFPDSWLSFLNNELYVFDGSATPLAGVIFSLSFLELRKRSRRLYYCAVGIGGLSLLGILLLPFSYRGSAMLAIVSILLCSIFLTVAGLVMMAKNYRPSRFFTLGWLVMILASAVWALTNLGILPYSAFFEWGTAIGGVVEASLTSLALGDKMRDNIQGEKHKVKMLNRSLRELNLNLEHDVEQKTRHIRSIMAHIKQGIFTIDSDYKIGRDYSRFLETVLARPGLQGYSLITALRAIEAPEAFLDRIQNILFMIFDEPVVAFELNESHLLGDVVMRDGKVLEFDWYPMLGTEGRVEKMLVSIRDVSEIRRLTLASESYSETMHVVAEILATKDYVFERFVDEAEALLGDSLNALLMPLSEALSAMPVLKINVHTFKGMAHSVNFLAMIQAAHELEQSLVDWNGSASQQLALQHQTRSLLELVKHYKETAQNQLGRQLDHSVLQVPIRTIHEWLYARSQAEVYENLVAMSTESLHDIIQGLGRDLKALARVLGKPNPDLVIEGDDERLELRMAARLRHSLLHVVRNALDHGIETARERQEQSKSAKGQIRFQIQRNAGRITLCVTDDGRGLNLEKIRDHVGRPASAGPMPESLETMASWIFLDGVSTAPQVSHISGRGVGMSAVKHFVEEMGGQVSIRLDQPLANGCYRFSLIITLEGEALRQQTWSVAS